MMCIWTQGALESAPANTMYGGYQAIPTREDGHPMPRSIETTLFHRLSPMQNV